MSFTTTRAPCAARSIAMARPTPRPPPVTTAALPSNGFVMLLLRLFASFVGAVQHGIAKVTNHSLCRHVSSKPVPVAGFRTPLVLRAVAGTAGGGETDRLSLREDMIDAIVRRLTIDLDNAGPAIPPAPQAGSGELATLGHEDDADIRVGAALQQDVLAEAAAIAAAAAAVGTHRLAVEEERAVTLHKLDRDVGDVARPGQAALSVGLGCGAHAAVEEQ